MALYAAAIFLSAFLLFQVQPIAGKYVLPWFGGAPSVWTTCLLFFQVMLLGGYGYAHLNASKLRPRWQARVHVGLLLAAAVTLPIIPAEAWKEHLQQHPIAILLLLLLVTVGLPFAVLSATGPLLQAWFARAYPERSPYPLYALSNAGSLLALLSFPFLFEPYVGRVLQAYTWSGGFVAFGVVCAACAWRVSRFETQAELEREAHDHDHDHERERETAETEPPPTRWRWFHWIGLAGSGTTLLMGVTNQLCVDVANIPFLWVMPLLVYLLTFILCFSGRAWYGRHWVGGLFLLVALIGGGSLIPSEWSDMKAQAIVPLAALLLFCACMFCHGELHRLRPGASHLTGFYLAISLGGALGGVFVGAVAPLVFPLFLELQVGIVIAALFVGAAWLKDSELRINHGWWRLAWGGPAGLLLALIIATGYQVAHEFDGAVAVSRNFYGVLRVKVRSIGDPLEERRVLYHGTTSHGMQYTAPARREWPTTYYGRESGVGLAFAAVRARHTRPVHVGIVGVGAGTIATYGRPGDRFRLYELDPDVMKMARAQFTYLADCRAKQETILGDGRLSLEREPAQAFDLLILDAFSSHAIPVHLLTREAVAVYLRHLRPDGVLALHISNLFFNLVPVVWAMGEEHGLTVQLAGTWGKDERGTFGAKWALLSRDPAALRTKQIEAAHEDTLTRNPHTFHAAHRWTDDFASMFSVLK